MLKGKGLQRSQVGDQRASMKLKPSFIFHKHQGFQMLPSQLKPGMQHWRQIQSARTLFWHSTRLWLQDLPKQEDEGCQQQHQRGTCRWWQSSSVKESGQGCDDGLVELLPCCRAEVENVLIGLSWCQSELHRWQGLQRWLHRYGWLHQSRRWCLSWRVATLALSRVRRSSTHAGGVSRA